MGEVLGLGITHYPLLLGTDDTMAKLLSMTLSDPDIPADAKDPANWTEQAREEWSDDKGAAAAGRHRAALLADLRRCREALDEFQPDVIVVWGDDQYENFREEVVPSFCLFAYEDTAGRPVLNAGPCSASPTPGDCRARGKSSPCGAHPSSPRSSTTDVINYGVELAYSYEPRAGINFPHAFANTQTFLDWDNVGQTFPYPIVAIAVNCYGEHVIARRGGLARFAEIKSGERRDPPARRPSAASSSVAPSVSRWLGRRPGWRSSLPRAGRTPSSTTRRGTFGLTPKPTSACTTP